MTHFKKYWYWYLIGILAAIYVIVSLTKKEWNPANWFASGAAAARKFMCPPGQVYGFNSNTNRAECHSYS